MQTFSLSLIFTFPASCATKQQSSGTEPQFYKHNNKAPMDIDYVNVMSECNGLVSYSLD
jgi:hypothetical protein